MWLVCAVLVGVGERRVYIGSAVRLGRTRGPLGCQKAGGCDLLKEAEVVQHMLQQNGTAAGCLCAAEATAVVGPVRLSGV